MHDGPQCMRPTSVPGGVSPVYMDYWSAVIISQHDRITWTMTMPKVQREQLQKNKLHLNVFMIIVSQWPPDITPQQSVWIQTLTYKQDIVDVSLRMFSEDREIWVLVSCWAYRTQSLSQPEFMGWPMGRGGRDFWWWGSTVTLLSYIYALWFVSLLVDSLVLRLVDSSILFVFPH